MTASRQPEPHPPTSRNWPLLAARTGLLTWIGFWSWFVISVMATEGAHPVPILSLLLLWAMGVVAWTRPRLGAFVLVAFGAWSLWYFANGASLWLIAAPAVALAVLCLAGAHRQHRLRGLHAAALPLCLAGVSALGGCAGTLG